MTDSRAFSASGTGCTFNKWSDWQVSLGGDISHIYVRFWTALPITMQPAFTQLRVLPFTIDLLHVIGEPGQQRALSALDPVPMMMTNNQLKYSRRSNQLCRESFLPSRFISLHCRESGQV